MHLGPFLCLTSNWNGHLEEEFNELLQLNEKTIKS